MLRLAGHPQREAKMNCPLVLEPALSVLFSCPLCVQPYRHPKILPCLHSFCDACLRRELPSQSFTLVCPVCRQQFILPPSGICSLQTNPFVTEFTRLYADGAQNAADDDSVQSDTFYCSSHAGQSLRFYCDDCDSAICSSCTDIEHREHRTTRLENAASHSRDVLQQIVELSKTKFKVVQSVTSQLEGAEQVLDEKQVQVLADIEDSFEKLFEGLGSRRQLLDLPLASTPQKNRFRQDAAACAAKVDQLTGIVDIAQRVLERGNPLHLILMKKLLDARADFFKPSSSPVLSPMVEPLQLKFDPNGLNEVKGSASEFGADGWITKMSGPLLDQILQIVPNRPYRICIAVRNPDGALHNSSETAMSPPKIHARGPLPTEISATASPSNGAPKGAPRLASSSQNSLSTHSDHSGVRSTPSPTRRISCPLHSASSSRITTPVGNVMKQRKPSFLLSLHVRDQGNCTFESAVTFPQEGHYEVHVTMGEQHVTGSPLKVDVSRPAARKSLDCKFMRTDSCRNSMSSRRSTSSCKQSDRLSPSPAKPPAPTEIPEDELIGRIGCRGRAKGEFTNPQDICCTSTGRILATDSNNQCVQVFTLLGEPRARFGERGRMVGQLQRPTGVAEFPSSNQYVVADYENRWVSIFEPNGKFVSRFGMGKLLGPKGVAVDGEGKIYVVDNKASSVCVFQKNGRLVGRFGSRGCTEDHLAGPHFIAINSFGHSVVSDFHNHAVKVFDTTGEFLYSFGSNGEGNGQFNAPTGIAVDAFDNILVADWGNSRVQVFDRHGSFLQTINSESDPLYGPQGLTLTPDGHVLVADSGNHCLKLFKYNNWVTSVSEVD